MVSLFIPVVLADVGLSAAVLRESPPDPSGHRSSCASRLSPHVDLGARRPRRARGRPAASVQRADEDSGPDRRRRRLPHTHDLGTTAGSPGTAQAPLGCRGERLRTARHARRRHLRLRGRPRVQQRGHGEFIGVAVTFLLTSRSWHDFPAHAEPRLGRLRALLRGALSSARRSGSADLLPDRHRPARDASLTRRKMAGSLGHRGFALPFSRELSQIVISPLSPSGYTFTARAGSCPRSSDGRAGCISRSTFDVLLAGSAALALFMIAFASDHRPHHRRRLDHEAIALQLPSPYAVLAYADQISSRVLIAVRRGLSTCFRSPSRSSSSTSHSTCCWSRGTALRRPRSCSSPFPGVRLRRHQGSREEVRARLGSFNCAPAVLPCASPRPVPCRPSSSPTLVVIVNAAAVYFCARRHHAGEPSAAFHAQRADAADCCRFVSCRSRP